MRAAIFIDGPIAGETMDLEGFPPTYRVPLPPRTTICDCDGVEEFPIPAEVVEYQRVTRGECVALYSVAAEEDIIRNVKAWVFTDFSHPWVFNCRDRRAWR